MLARVRELPRQLTQARRVAASVTLDDRHRDVDLVLVLGMGGSAIGAELVGGPGRRPPAGAADRASRLRAAGVGRPAHAGDRRQPLGRHGRDRSPARPRRDGAACRWWWHRTGGALGRQAETDGTPFLRYEAPGQPRAAIGFGVGLIHELLIAAGLLSDPDPLGPAVEALESMLERNAPSVETDANPAKQLAWAMFGRIPIVFGAGAMTAVAHRWKTQLNENAKAWAMFEPMPEANHNAIEGTPQPARAVRRPVRRRAARARRAGAIGARYRVVEELLGERATNRSVVWAEGPSAAGADAGRASRWATWSASISRSSTRPTRPRLHCWQC